jgi:predicted DNA-binding transcriptional regulator AlpA
MICKILSISRRTLRYWVKKNVLPEPLRLGPDGRNLRWHPADVVEYLKMTSGHAGAHEALSQLPKGSGAGEVP